MSNDNTESISAKLRRWADESENDNRRHIYPTFNAYDDLCIEVREDDCTSERKLFRRIADEIDAEKQSTLRNCAYPLTQEVGKPLKGDEDFKSWLDRYYLPRPLFEDGEPVQFGDEIEHPDSGKTCSVNSIHVFEDGYFAMALHGDRASASYEVGKRVKRPKQPVLDADGVPIEVGDTVWTINVPKGHDKRTVKGFKTFEEMGTTDVPSTHAVLFEDSGWMGNLRVTHREPDSLEKLQQEVCGYMRDLEGDTDTIDEYERRFTSLMERDA